MPHTDKYGYKGSMNCWTNNACLKLTPQPVWDLDFQELHFLCTHCTFTLIIYLGLIKLVCLMIKITSDTQFRLCYLIFLF